MIRLFIALHIPEEIKENIYLDVKRIVPGFNTYKWENPFKIHLTLKFIGDFDEKLIPDLESSLEFLKDFEQYKCTLSDFNFFYRNKKPSIFFIDLIFDKNINILVNRINAELLKFGIPEEKRDFKSHLTLLRLKGHEDITALQQLMGSGIPKQEFTTSDVVLFKSELRPSGSVYTVLKNYKLKRSII